jgi:hypothetical protein
MKGHFRRAIVAAIMAIVAASGFAAGVRGDVLYQQTPGNSQVSSQTFTDAMDFSTYEFDDFVVGATAWTVSKVTIAGNEEGDPMTNTAVKLAITTAADFTMITTTYDGIEDQTGNLVFDNLNIALDPGATVWITAWVERSSTPGLLNQWFWSTADDGNPIGSEEIFHNPGGGFGFGTDPIPGSMVFGTPADLAFTIEGTAGP